MSEVTRDTSLDVQALANASKGQKSVSEANHGDVVVGEDGVAGIVIDKGYEAEKSLKESSLGAVADYIKQQNQQIADLQAGKAVDMDTPINADEEELSDEMKQKLQNDEAIRRVREQFAQFEPTADGIAPAGSAEAKEYQQKMQDLAEGKAVLPTAEEAQKMEEQRIREDEIKARQAEAAANNASAEDQFNVTGKADTVQFNVPEGQVKSFISTLSTETRANISRSQSIVINEVKKRDVPTSTRTIKSLDEFKRIIPQKKHSEVIGIALPNSGLYATFKGAGSLAMATILPDLDTNQVDYQKRYQFCHDCLVDTSIGKLSLSEFCAYVSNDDLELCLFAILRASEADENTIVLECGNEDCKSEYEVKYKLTELLDVDSITKETNDQVTRIIQNKDVFDNAKEVFESSPTMTTKQIDVTDGDGNKISIDFRIPNGTVTIDRQPHIQEIMQNYNQYILGFILWIPRIYYTVQIEGDETAEPYMIDDAMVIAEVLSTLDDEVLRTMGQVVSGMAVYGGLTFSFKGDYRCPKCGRRETKIPCRIDDLLFYKVGKAMQ